MTNSTPGEFVSSSIRANEKGKERERKGTSRKRCQGRVVDSGNPRKRYRGDKGSLGEGCGHGAGITDGRGQRGDDGKEAWSLSTANKAGDGGFHARSRFATPSYPLLDACQSGT